MRASPRDLFDVYKGTFDYLHQNEPMGLLVFTIHCQFGGRPLITAVLQEVLKYMQQSRDVWFARHEELARWALAPMSTSTAIRAGSSATPPRLAAPCRARLIRDFEFQFASLSARPRESGDPVPLLQMNLERTNWIPACAGMTGGGFAGMSGESGPS